MRSILAQVDDIEMWYTEDADTFPEEKNAPAGSVCLFKSLDAEEALYRRELGG
jgi:hypothetical protein